MVTHNNNNNKKFTVIINHNDTSKKDIIEKPKQKLTWNSNLYRTRNFLRCSQSLTKWRSSIGLSGIVCDKELFSSAKGREEKMHKINLNEKGYELMIAKQMKKDS